VKFNDYDKDYGRRIEIFEIGQFKQFIGCELTYGRGIFRGVAWICISYGGGGG